MLERRRRLIESTELNKTIRKWIKEDRRKYQENRIEANRNLKWTKNRKKKYNAQEPSR